MHSAFVGSRVRGWRRIAFALLAVPGILIGLLAMHTLTISHDGSSPELHAMMTTGGDSHYHSLSAQSAHPTICEGLCSGGHDMLSM